MYKVVEVFGLGRKKWANVKPVIYIPLVDYGMAKAQQGDSFQHLGKGETHNIWQARSFKQSVEIL